MFASKNKFTEAVKNCPPPKIKPTWRAYSPTSALTATLCPLSVLRTAPLASCEIWPSLAFGP
jgi:hypothetical protein